MQCFVDSNLFVYAYDHAQPAKQRHAAEVLAALVLPRRGVISTQVLGEFSAVCGIKIADPLDALELDEAIEDIATMWRVRQISLPTIGQAIRLRDRYRINYWDAQILATALEAGCECILTEDVLAARIEGVTYLDPFGPEFELRAFAASLS